MRLSVSLALMLMIFGSVRGAAQDEKPSWYSDSSEKRITFFYGVRGTDHVGFHVSCDRANGSIELIPSLREAGLKAGETAKVSLSTRDRRVEFEGKVFVNEETGENNIRITPNSIAELEELFLKPGSLAITMPNDGYKLPIGPHAVASFASFRKQCPPSDKAVGSGK